MKFKLVIKRPQKDQICHIWTLKRQFGNPVSNFPLNRAGPERRNQSPENVKTRASIFFPEEPKKQKA